MSLQPYIDQVSNPAIKDKLTAIINHDLPMDLLEAIIAFKREDKAGATTYFK